MGSDVINMEFKNTRTINNLDLKQIAESGQCFRWEEVDESTFLIPGESYECRDREPLLIRQKGNSFDVSCSDEEGDSYWRVYLDLNTDYEAIGRLIMNSGDDHVKECYELGSGIRILKQDLWEMIITFLISQNNNIGRITGSVKKLCNICGHFPYPGDIDIACLENRELGLGYRVKFLQDMYLYGQEHPELLALLPKLSYAEAMEELVKRNGIGPKVANCVCLFGLHHVEAFPVDTHVRQLLDKYYPSGFDYGYYGSKAGIIQQYLFYYELKHKGN